CIFVCVKTNLAKTAKKQQNAKLVLTQTNMQFQLDQSNKMVAKLMLEIEQLKKGDDKHAN
ncbi:UNVERIFIED_CONTAM: hypothetical protein QQG02_09245, partial [Melissococcus plutonius]